MTPKEKAKELIELFTFSCRDCDNSKISALIAVDKIREALIYGKLDDSPYTSLEARQFYLQVKQEIENL
jgi:hypothetical protein